MKHLKKFNQLNEGQAIRRSLRRKKRLGPRPRHLVEKEEKESDIFAILTKELKEKKKRQKLLSMAHDAYHIRYNGISELIKLREKYPIGGTYKGEIICQTSILNSKEMGE